MMKLFAKIEVINQDGRNKILEEVRKMLKEIGSAVAIHHKCCF